MGLVLGPRYKAINVLHWNINKPRLSAFLSRQRKITIVLFLGAN